MVPTVNTVCSTEHNKLKLVIENATNQNQNFLRAIRRLKKNEKKQHIKMIQLNDKLKKINEQTIKKVIKTNVKKLKKPEMTLKELNAQIAKNNYRVEKEKDAFYAKWEKLDDKQLLEIEKKYDNKINIEKKSEIKKLKKGRELVYNHIQSSPLFRRKSRKQSKKRKASTGSRRKRRSSFQKSLEQFRKSMGNLEKIKSPRKSSRKSSRKSPPKNLFFLKKSPDKKSSRNIEVINIPIVRSKKKK
jgi:uncharacterized coiled-coil protein SlyX